MGKTLDTSSSKGTSRVHTDAILTIKPEFVKLLAARTKNHEYRKYKLRPSVKRLWLYETAPISAITHVLCVGMPRMPGEVKDPTGIGNDDFDAGRKESKYGYPVKSMYRLRSPLTARDMGNKYGQAAPQGYMYALEQLLEDHPLDKMDVLY